MTLRVEPSNEGCQVSVTWYQNAETPCGCLGEYYLFGEVADCSEQSVHSHPTLTPRSVSKDEENQAGQTYKQSN